MPHALDYKASRHVWPALALLVSLLLHVALLAGGGFGWMRPLPAAAPSSTLAIRLQAPPPPILEPRPAQAAHRVPREPLPSTSVPAHTTRAARVRDSHLPVRAVVVDPAPATVRTAPPQHMRPAPASGRIDAQGLLAQVAQIEQQNAAAAPPAHDETQLVGDLGVDWQLYIDAWQQRIEGVGHQYFPDAVRRLGISGGPRLGIEINADGSLGKVTLLRKSQYPVLDEAAIHIVRLAKKFAPLPPRIAAQHKSMTITRTLVFGVDDGLAAR